MKLTKIPYKSHPLAEYFRTVKSPSGKNPFIIHKGKLIPDTQFIIEYLITQYPQESDLDAGLSPEQLAQSHLIRKMLEESTYFVMLRQRWLDDKNWEITKHDFFRPPLVPTVMIPLISWGARRKTYDNCWGQGIGRHPEENYRKIGMQDFDALANILGDKSFIMGDKPTSVDAVAYSFVVHCVWVPFDDSLKDYVLKNHKNLLEYAERMHQLCFPELVPECKPKLEKPVVVEQQQQQEQDKSLKSTD